MMMAKKETAEQKLLKMIEASAGPGASGSSKAQQAAKKKQNLLSLVKFSNKALMVGVVISAIWLVNEIFAGATLLGRDVKLSAIKGSITKILGDKDLIPLGQNISYYLASINRRNIFVPYEDLQPKSGEIEVSDKNREIVNQTEKFRLVGVSWLDKVDTASVMIEDAEKKVTYFLKVGEKVGDIVVKTIYADSAVLGYKNEEIVIRYDKSQM